jgi:hypothetical protein
MLCSVDRAASRYMRRVMEPTAFTVYLQLIQSLWGHAVAHWLGQYATNRKVAGSIPDGVIAIFH